MKKKIQSAFILAMALFSQSAFAQTNPPIKFNSKISNLSGDLGDVLHADNHFGRQLANIGDLNGDGVEDLAVCAEVTDNFSKNGGIYILFMNADGTVNSKKLITQSQSGLNTTFPNPDYKFGYSVAKVADLDGDGVIELAAGALNDNGYTGAVWILFMKSDGTVKSFKTINSQTQGLSSLGMSAFFGHSVASPGDIDGDGNADIVVCAPNSNSQTGNAYTLFLNSNGTVKGVKALLGTTGAPVPGSGSFFGTSVAALGDINADGIQDIAIGAIYNNDGGINKSGAIYLINLKSDGSVKSFKKWSNDNGNMPELNEQALLGSGITIVPDQNGDGRNDLLVGAYMNSFDDIATGSAYLLFPDANYDVDSYALINDQTSGMGQKLEDQDFFGRGVAFIKANISSSKPTNYLVMSAPYDDDNGNNTGALYLLETTPQSSSAIAEVPALRQVNISAYPNPAQTTVQLNIPGYQASKPLSFSITDINGKQVSAGIMSANGGSGYLFDVSAFQAGIYFMTIQGAGFVGHTKIVKQ